MNTSYYGKERVWIGVGSNLMHPKQQVDLAVWKLSKLPSSKLIACSSYYCSRPLGLQNQPNFLNMIVILDTALSPEILLYHMQYIENQQGRIRNSLTWQSRTLDLDILLFGKYFINNSKLVIPHYDMVNREFVIYPLLELDCNLILPNGKNVKDIVKVISRNGLIFWYDQQ